MMAFQLTPEPALCSWFRTLLQVLAPILSSKDLLSFWGIDPELKIFQKKISKVQDLLNNAEQRSQEICVSNWMDNLRELLYDMEDFVDEMNIERVWMQQQAAIRNQSAPSHHVAYGFYDNIASNSLQKYDIKRRLAVVLARLDDVVTEANELELKPRRVGGGSMSSVEVRVVEDNVVASVDESDVYGREKDKDRIIEQLLDPTDSSRKNYAVISIVGMGGLGKTTLAKLIFNDQRIKDNFGTRGWACVSDVFDFNRVVKELTEQATKQNVFDMAPSALCRRLETAVQDEKILIVLDDVWEAKAWDRLKASFTRCASGSKILVTTRDKNVGDAICIKEPYELGILEDEHCWNLFEEKAFAFGGVIDGSLEKIGRGIVKKCRGIPLAVKVIGSSLRFAPKEMWERALDSELWQSVDQAKEEIFPALKLSYHYLPSPLKRCFGYLSLFPTDFYLNKQQVVRLWIAEGLVESRADMLWEDIGNGYYHELQRRCLIQEDNKMHDLVLSLARYVLSSKFGYSCAANGSTGLSMRLGSIRHLSLTGDDHLDLNAFEESKHLRTFLLFEGQTLHKIPEWSLRLRVLDLGGNFMAEELPDFIGSLKHLRYLNLSRNRKLKELPDSICKLHHLQALDLSWCFGIRGLPSDIGNLGSLRYLLLSGASVSVLPNSIAQLVGLIELDLNICVYLTCIPEDIGSLQNLRTLNLQATGIVSLPDSISKLQKLQVLNLSHCRCLFNLPDQIGCLGALRMLDLEDTPLSHLPKSIGKLHNLRSLNVHGSLGQATQLSEDILNLSSLECLVFDFSHVRLPQGIGKLRNLKWLPEYSVGKEAGRGIEELKDMNKLEGPLAISHLENVESVEKALSANLKSKVYINELRLQWRSSPGTPSSSDDEDSDTKSGDNGKSEMEEKVLDALEPHPKGLKGLSLLNYCGGRTPKWMSDLRFLSLKDLRMEGLVCMERVMDIELPSLEFLKIENCPELRVVSMGLPNLEKLMITRCEELKALCLSPSLIIQDCSSASDHRSYSRMELPQLVEIRMEDCPSLRVAICMTMPKLERVIMEDCGELKLMGFTDIVLEGGPSSDIEIKNYKGRWLPLLAEDDEDKAAGSTSFFPNVGRLQIENCPNLAVLQKALHTIASLRTLDISYCPQLASLPELPPMLEDLRIKSCTNLQHLPTNLGDLTYLKDLRMEGLVCMERVMDLELPSLESLKIENCPELRVVSMGLPNLKKLLITRCEELKALCLSPSLIIQDCSSASDHRSYSRMELPQLVEIRMEHCPRVAICMTMPKLEELIMEDCGELTLMGFTDIVLEGGPSSDIEIKNYKGRWLPLLAEDDEDKAAGSASFFPNVGRLQIENCPNLAVLPKALHTIASLRTLDISYCPQLASLPELPPMLEDLRIESCKNLQHLPTNLGDLTYLMELRMEGLVCMERVIDIELPSLVSLKIENCPELRVVSMGLPNLKEFVIERCQELKALCMSPSLIIQDCSSASDHRSYSRMELPQLVEIRMEDCPSLRVAICMTMPKLERVIMEDCGELKQMGFTDIVLEGGPSSDIEIKNYKGRWLPLLAEDDEDKAAGSTSFFPNVGRLQIENCPNLAVLPKALHTIASLRTLDISYCPQLASLPELPPMLEDLRIKSCTNLQHLPTNLGDLTYLKDLRMEGLVCMERVMDLELPSLESLKIENCPELRVVSMGLPNLKQLLIERCEELKALCMSPSLISQDCSSASVHRSYSRMELPQLVELRIHHCPCLRAAICMTMPKLEGLIMEGCGELTLMGFTDIVLEGGPSSDIEIKNYKGRWLPLLAEDDEDKAAGSTSFFPNVGRLQIENCPNLAVLPKALHTIASLRTLDISYCPQLASLPELPPMLEDLRIKSCTNLQHLPTNLGDLTYLKDLRMEGLVCMERVMDLELPSLESLKIENCPELRVVSMGLPNLKKLLITRCEELKALCLSPSLIIQDCSSASDHRSYSRMELPQLVEIRMEHCPRVAICMTMPKLEELIMEDCGELTLMGFTDIVLEGGPSSDIEIKNYKGRWLPLLAEDDEDKAAGSASFFPNVGRLQIENCPNLAVLPKALHTIASLRTLDISYCPQLASLPELPPMLEDLRIESCKNLQHLPTNLGDLTYLMELRMEGLVCMERVIDIELPSLVSLNIENCPELRVVSMGLPNLKELVIERCQELKALCMSPSLIIQDCSSASDHRSYSRMELPQLVEIRMEDCPSLRVAICMTMPKLERVIMEDCGELKLMGFTDIVLEGGPSSDIEIKNYKGRWLPLLAEDDEDKAAGSTSFFPNVGRLQIENCPNLAVLQKALHTIASLRTLDISYCPQLASLPELPPMLEDLRIKSCTNLQHLPTNLGDLTYLKDLRMEGLVCMERVMDLELPSLESLKIENCPELRVVSMGLPNLKKLLITRCEELKALCLSPSLIIQDCSSASDHRSYSRMELPQLVEIRMEHCPRVAICMTMPKLEELIMEDCGELTLMGFTDIVLEGGPSSNIEIKNYKGRWLPLLAEDDEDKAAGPTSFFPNVGQLLIENCPNLAVLPKALHTIASLRTLEIIYCPQLASFPELPPKLEYLDIDSCTNLQHLPTNLGYLTYLRFIRITYCPCLQARPEDRLPSNVEGMYFRD